MDQTSRVAVRLRAEHRCEYCLLPAASVVFPFHIEHIIARQHAGGDDLDNLALACDRCNWLKGPNLSSIDPGSNQLVRLFHPRQDAWSEHFSLAGFEIIGRTDVGRATVALLKLNERRRLIVRRRLIARGEFVVPGS